MVPASINILDRDNQLITDTEEQNMNSRCLCPRQRYWWHSHSLCASWLASH